MTSSGVADGGDVVVRGRFTQDQVADAAAGPESLVTGLPQAADDLQRKLTGRRRFTHSGFPQGLARSRPGDGAGARDRRRRSLPDVVDRPVPGVDHDRDPGIAVAPDIPARQIGQDGLVENPSCLERDHRAGRQMFDKMSDHLVQARGVDLVFAIGRIEEDGDGAGRRGAGTNGPSDRRPTA